jgi:hypothetical protein
VAYTHAKVYDVIVLRVARLKMGRVKKNLRFIYIILIINKRAKTGNKFSLRLATGGTVFSPPSLIYARAVFEGGQFSQVCFPNGPCVVQITGNPRRSLAMGIKKTAWQLVVKCNRRARNKMQRTMGMARACLRGWLYLSRSVGLSRIKLSGLMIYSKLTDDILNIVRTEVRYMQRPIRLDVV